MDIHDYDKALYYAHRSEWHELLVLMVNTEDHFLSKKIERFLHAYSYSSDYSDIERKLYALLRYLDFAIEKMDTGRIYEESYVSLP